MVSERFSFNETGNFVELNGKYYLRYLEHQQGLIRRQFHG